FPTPPEEIYRYFLDPPVTDEYRVEWREPDREAVARILVDEHDFSPQRVGNALDRLERAYREHVRSRQTGLDAWFG
ncbi:MAG: flap structure-specific endonuclease, partial [Candidatus Korarchaeota archaeon]|nr:flap structure-specific endonuclease [Candidatus Korarchaeota archaeon]